MARILPFSILFLCTGNTCRSQMAEGWVRKLNPGLLDPFSAGTRPGSIDPRVIRVMAEAGVDISKQRPENLERYTGKKFDFVVTICNDALKTCPHFPGPAIRFHRSFDDPPKIAAAVSDEEMALASYRRVRDEIKDYVVSLQRSITVLINAGLDGLLVFRDD